MKLLALLAAFAWSAHSAGAVTIRVDYQYDAGSKFFGANNPQGASGAADARETLQAVADFYSDILDDTLESVELWQHVFPNGTTVNWNWTAGFTDPQTGFGRSIVSDHVDNRLPIGADEYVIFVGARFLASATVGTASPGVVEGVGWQASRGLSSAQEDVVDAMTNDFIQAVSRRGESTGFVSWGGSVSFDDDPNNDWHFDHTTSPTGDEVDLYSVALHEFAHALGFGASDEWDGFVSGTTFTGPAAMAEHSGPVPLVSSLDRSHWQNGTASTVYGGTAPQEAAMDPSLTLGLRKRITALDAAALSDIGWELALPPPPPVVPGDYNGNGIVDAADYTVWRDTLGQTGPNLPANGDNTGASANRVDQADYTYWAARFGNLTSSGSGALSPVFYVPEPTSAALFLLNMALFALAGGRGSRGTAVN